MVDISRRTETLSRPTETLSRPTELLSRQTETLGSAFQRKTETLEETTSSGPYIHIGTNVNGYVLTEIIAENTGEASIFLGKKDEQSFVIKLYHHGKNQKQETLEKIIKLDSPFIIKIIETGEYGGRHYEILPYFKKGDLQNGDQVDDQFIINQVVPSINEGLKTLHDVGIVHRDIKPNNIFYRNDEKGVVIGDFGISSVLNENVSVRMTSMSRTIGYSAPETTSGSISKEVDYYSFGITLLHLSLGQDPFYGMNDQQIIVQTLNYNLPIPNTVHPRIAQLIKGLTVKDRQNRWGYDEVSRWIKGEHISTEESYQSRQLERPYIFEGEELYELTDLSMAFARNWQEAINHLYRGLIAKHIEQVGQDLASKVMDCEEEPNTDLGLFKLLYLLNPDAPLCWRGEIFWDLAGLRKKLNEQLPMVNEDYLAFFTSGALTEYLHTKQADKQLMDDLLEALSYEDEGEIYWRVTLLLQSIDEHPVYMFTFDDQVFRTVNELNQYLVTQADRMEELSEQLITNRYFFHWLAYKGFSEQITRWKNIYEEDVS